MLMLQDLFVDKLLEDLYKTKETVEKVTEWMDKTNTKKPPQSSSGSEDQKRSEIAQE